MVWLPDISDALRWITEPRHGAVLLVGLGVGAVVSAAVAFRLFRVRLHATRILMRDEARIETAINEEVEPHFSILRRIEHQREPDEVKKEARADLRRAQMMMDVDDASISPKPDLGRDMMFALRASVSAAKVVLRTSPTATRALETQSGKLVEKIPRQMQVGVREPVEIRLGTPEASDLMLGLVGSGLVTKHDIDIVETMSIELFSPDGAFKVEGVSPPTQLVRRDVLRDTSFAKFAADFGQWIWYVTPQERGKHPLSIRVSASVLDSKGAQANAALPDRMIEIEVSVSFAREGASLSRKVAALVASGSVTGAIGAIVGALTKDYWWPLVAPFFR